LKKNGQENVCYSGIKMLGITEGQDDQGPPGEMSNTQQF